MAQSPCIFVFAKDKQQNYEECREMQLEEVQTEGHFSLTWSWFLSQDISKYCNGKVLYAARCISEKHNERNPGVQTKRALIRCDSCP